MSRRFESHRSRPLFILGSTGQEDSTDRAGRCPAADAGSPLYLVLAILVLSATAALAAWPWSRTSQLYRRACGQPEGVELLIAAANTDDLEGVKLALDQGVAPDGTDEAYAPLDLTDDPVIVRLLLARGANPSMMRYRATPLGCAVIRGNMTIVKILLDAGADPNQHDPGSASPLECARMRGFIDIARLLLRRGAIPTESPDAHAALDSPAAPSDGV